MVDKHIRFDWAIKKLLRNKANFEILEGFLSELLKDDIVIQTILESESNQEYDYDKYNRVDILVKVSSGELVLIEIQNEKEHNYFHRMAYGAAKIITEQIKLGQKYNEIKKVYSINIVYFDLGQGNDYIYLGETNFKGLHTNEDLALSNKQKALYKINSPSEIFTSYYILKLNKFNDIAKDGLDEWVYFLKNSEIKDEFKAKGLAKAKENLRVDDMSPAEKEAYYIYMKGEMIRQSEIDTAIEDGKDINKKELDEAKLKIEEAKIQLEEESKKLEAEKLKLEAEKLKLEAEKLKLEASIKMLLSMGVDANTIASQLNISLQEVEKLIV